MGSVQVGGLLFERKKSFQQASQAEVCIEEGALIEHTMQKAPWEDGNRWQPFFPDSGDEDPQWDYSDEDPWVIALEESEEEDSEED